MSGEIGLLKKCLPCKPEGGLEFKFQNSQKKCQGWWLVHPYNPSARCGETGRSLGLLA